MKENEVMNLIKRIISKIIKNKMKTMVINRFNQTGWKNKVGTGDEKCPCGSWKNHWEKYSHKKFDEQDCSVVDCSKKAEDGAHIFEDKEVWIAPLCRSHNKIEEPFDLNIGTILVNADKKKTCDPKSLFHQNRNPK